MRADGSRSEDFCDLVKEMRDHWSEIRGLPYFKRSPWFRWGIEALLNLSHRRDDSEYVAGIGWLAGQVKQIGVIRAIGRRAGGYIQVPSLPQTKDTGLVYAYNLVVLHEVVKALGYKGLAIIIDEAEHVRSYSFNRYKRANNFFDILARCAHKPREGLPPPTSDYDHLNLPAYWKEGPHFALFVGLTEGEDTQDLQRKVGEIGVLIQDKDDVVHLSPPTASDYDNWSLGLLRECAERLGPRVRLLSDPTVRSRIAEVLREHFDQTPEGERILRNWTKLAGFPAAILLAKGSSLSADELVAAVEDAARQVSREVLPWEL
jgi:hypothetical protein